MLLPLFKLPDFSRVKLTKATQRFLCERLDRHFLRFALSPFRHGCWDKDMLAETCHIRLILQVIAQPS